MLKFISLILSFVTVISMAAEGIPYAFRPTLQVDANSYLGEVSSRASGYLYGVAENGVPDSAVVESLDVSSISQKVIDGLQHPIGDVDHVAPMLDNCDYITVYMQDCFDTWYYCHQEINDLRAEGNYDSMEFVRERFLPQVEEATRKLIETDYQDRLVYCLYNETDNAVWFGTPSEDGTWLMYDDAAKQRFYEAWKVTYDLVRSIDTDAVIGGPGYCDYDYNEIKDFLEFCKANDCMPDVMIYHELGEFSSYFWQDHVDEYRELEDDMGIEDMPIIVTEYGTMYECGAPADMMKYITAIENSGAYANAAYWRLANNLNDTVADNNSPNSNWWLFRWYADMDGYLLDAKIIDITHADFENAIKYGYDRFHYKYFNGISSMTENKDEITVLCGGADYDSYVNFKHLGKTNLGKKVNVKIESVCFEGLSGIVSEPTLVAEYTDRVVAGKLRVDLENPDRNSVYHITLTPAEDKLMQEIAAAQQTGAKVTLSSDVALTNSLVIDKNVTIDLNGKNLTGGLFTESNGAMTAGQTDSYVFWVKKGATLTIEGEGTIVSQAAPYSMAVWAQGGEVVINGGNFYNNGEGSDLIYASAGGTVIINGGKFVACEKQAGVSGTQEKRSALNIKGDGTNSSITVYGGTFFQFDPANNKSENPKINFVAPDYKSVYDNATGYYTVVRE
jgi:hypothetical protein